MSIQKVIIIGSGPAAHTAAIYTARARLNPLMFEGLLAGGIAAGGQLTTTTEIENYPGFPKGISGDDLMEQMRQQSLNSGADILTKTVDRVDLNTYPFKIFVKNTIFLTHSLIIATGATAKRLNLPNEDLFWQKGISTCAICDGALPIFRNQILAVIGGGDSACEEAGYLTKYGKKVYLIHRRDQLRASKIMQERTLKNPKIEILWNSQIINLNGKKKLEELEIESTQNKKSWTLKASGLFYAIGHTPNTHFLSQQIALDDQQYITTQAGSTKTNKKGVFAAGDVQDKTYKQAITAAATGCMAALDVEEFLIHSQ